jgi:hypothetical protein
MYIWQQLDGGLDVFAYALMSCDRRDAYSAVATSNGATTPAFAAPRWCCCVPESLQGHCYVPRPSAMPAMKPMCLFKGMSIPCKLSRCCI